MDLRELRNFVTTAELLSFRRAAESQFISQPALSRRIAGLERELGVQLFERSGRGIQLTDPGRVLLGQAKRLLEWADEIVAEVRAIPAVDETPVTVALSADAAASQVAGLLCELQRNLPETSVVVRTGDWSTHLDEIVAGTVDVAFGYLPHSFGGTCEARPLWEIPFDLLLPESHPMAGRELCTIDQFSTDRIMIPTRDVGMAHRDRLVHHCVQSGFEPSIEDGHPDNPYSLAAVQVAVATGRGAGFVPRQPVEDLPPHTVPARLASPVPPGVVGAVWRASGRPPLIDRLLELAGDGMRVIDGGPVDRPPLQLAGHASAATA